MVDECYVRFMEAFSSRLREEHPDVCFYVWGSYVKGTCRLEKGSDIDGGIILDSGLITPKGKIKCLSEILSECLDESRVKVNFNLTDRESAREGRFLSYTTDYTDYLKSNGKIICGPDFISEMRGLDYKSGYLDTSAFNLRKVRNKLFTFYDSKDKQEEVRSILSCAVKFPRKLIWLQTGELVDKEEDLIKNICRIIPSFNVAILEELNLKREKSFLRYLNVEEYFSLAQKGTGAVETMIQKYLRAFPEISPRECKF